MHRARLVLLARGPARFDLALLLVLSCGPSARAVPAAPIGSHEPPPSQDAGEPPESGTVEQERDASALDRGTAVAEPDRAAQAAALVIASGPAQASDAQVAEPARGREVVPSPDRSACDQRIDDPSCSASFGTKAACPASFSEVPIGSYCGIQGRTQGAKECTYPEGRCGCTHTPYCGGAYPSLLQQTGMQWSCRALRAPSDCPDEAAPGGRCSVKSQQCGYVGCGVTTRCTCTNGHYQCQAEHWAPPPSAAPAR